MSEEQDAQNPEAVPEPGETGQPPPAPTDSDTPLPKADDPDDAANAALLAAQAAISALGSEATAASSGDQPEPFAAPAFSPTENEAMPEGLDLLSDVDVNVTIELGRTRMLVEDVLRLAEGAVVELDKLAGDPVDVFVNERLVARGEVLVLNDNFCIRVNEILDADTVEED